MTRPLPLYRHSFPDVVAALGTQRNSRGTRMSGGSDVSSPLHDPSSGNGTVYLLSHFDADAVEDICGDAS